MRGDRATESNRRTRAGGTSVQATGGLNMAHHDDIALMAHLMRRAGFGASRDELEARVAKGYEATVEELLNYETQPAVDEYQLMRYQPAALLPGGQPPMG